MEHLFVPQGMQTTVWPCNTVVCKKLRIDSTRGIVPSPSGILLFRYICDNRPTTAAFHHQSVQRIGLETTMKHNRCCKKRWGLHAMMFYNNYPETIHSYFAKTVEKHTLARDCNDGIDVFWCVFQSDLCNVNGNNSHAGRNFQLRKNGAD